MEAVALEAHRSAAGAGIAQRAQGSEDGRFNALEDQSEAERGGCDRRDFSERRQCIGTKETERCGTTLLSSALLPSLYAAHRILFQMFSQIFMQRLAYALACAASQRPLAFCSQFSMSSRTM